MVNETVKFHAQSECVIQENGQWAAEAFNHNINFETPQVTTQQWNQSPEKVIASILHQIIPNSKGLTVLPILI